MGVPEVLLAREHPLRGFTLRAQSFKRSVLRSVEGILQQTQTLPYGVDELCTHSYLFIKCEGHLLRVRNEKNYSD